MSDHEMTVKEQLDAEFDDVEFPAKCRCGFKASDPTAMVTHVMAEHAEMREGEDE